MQTVDLITRSPAAALATTIRGGLQAGQVGAVFARAGTGKSAFMVQVALDALLRGTRVLHVSMDHPQAHVRTYYEEILNAFAGEGELDRTTALAIERHRVIHSCLGRKFSPEDLKALLDMLEQVMDFKPGLVLVDGLDGADLAASAWIAAATDANVRLWLSVRTHRGAGPQPAELATAFTTAIALDPSGAQVELQILRQAGQAPANAPVIRLDPTTLLIQRGGGDHTQPSASPAADACTLYATGADGAEAVFGQLAERHGMAEVNFTTDGHDPVRSRGRTALDRRALAAGDVSMVYVATRLHRQWQNDDSVRRVLQLLWQVVSNADQVFVVGSIQADNTVVGGTGWSVELARRWRKEVWVFDQGQNQWFTWNGKAWTTGSPTIKATRFAGTGTRHLSAEGHAAIEALFARSFSN